MAVQPKTRSNFTRALDAIYNDASADGEQELNWFEAQFEEVTRLKVAIFADDELEPSPFAECFADQLAKLVNLYGKAQLVAAIRAYKP